MSNNQKSNRMLFRRKKLGVALIAIVLALLTAKPVWRALAAAGDLDMSFSGGGRYKLPLAFPASNTGYGRNVDEVLIQADPNNVQVERVIAAYSNGLTCIAPGANYDFLLTRLTSSGTKDSAFGNNGYATINFDSTGLPVQNGTVTALALQSNNKILVAGNLCTGGGNAVGLARLTVDGDLDTSFSGDGLWFFLGISEVSDMVVQSDGKILLVGRMLDSTGTYWKSALWRFNTNGTPDGSFGTNGYLHTTVWSGSSTDGGVREGFKSVYVQSDGKIVALNNNGSGYRLRRYTANGAVDFTLQVNAATGDSGNSIRPVSSNIWVIGSTGGSSGQYGAIFARNSANGSPDASFGDNGKVVSSQPSVWADSAPMPFSFPSKYVIAGWNSYPPVNFGRNEKAVITRYSGTGVLDTSFGTNGSTEETIGFLFVSPHSRYSSIRIGLSGKIVTGGQGGNFDLGFPPNEFGVVARYLGN
ncbi:MAG: hypothetical protein JNK38_29115 [Acidobacteria bacterium]|nr:hypothetical protein [Acidobacteriota bacterium]